MRDLDRLAREQGIELSYVSETGEHRVITDEVKLALLTALGASEQSRPVDADRSSFSGATRPCFMPPWLRDGRAWGITVQLYGLRSGRNSGIGDFEDLARLAEIVAAHGADFVGINPLHALFLREPTRASPYSPSSRQFLNPLYIAIDQLGSCDPDEAERLRGTEFVDYEGIARHKRAALREAFDCRRGPDPEFEQFCAEEGDALHLFATFEAIGDAAQGTGSGWSQWPDELKCSHSPSVLHFAETHEQEVRFHKWLQWIARRQLDAAHRRAKAAGMRIGLYADLAVGVAPDGAATWADPALVSIRARVGAPPDAFNLAGQDWGLAPMVPRELVARRFNPFACDARALMRSAGAIRIDHAMGLQRLYWIPAGSSSRDGGYVRYPLDGLLNILAQLSHAHETLVIGEDLGTVAPGFREIMRRNEILGNRVFFFERLGDGRYVPPAGYPKEALATLSTHDLPTLAGWWSGADIDARSALGLLPGDERSARDARSSERQYVLAALRDEGLLSGPPRSCGEVQGDLPAVVALALNRFLARTPCRLFGMQLEDLAGAREQVNLPGTTHEHPNWRRKVALSLEELGTHPHVVATLGAVAHERPRRS